MQIRLYKRISYSILIILTSLFQQPCFAVYFNKLGVEDGLSQGTVISVVQDRYGFIWIGTGNGLNRYDGIEFINFSADNNSNSKLSLSDSRIQNILADEDGNLWVSTRDGFNFFNTQTYQIKQYLHDPADPYSLPHNTTDISQFDSKGFLWIATGAGLTRFDVENQKFKTYLDEAIPGEKTVCSNIVGTLSVDLDDNIWTGGSNSLCRFNSKTESFTFIDFRNDIKLSTSTAVVEVIYHSPNEVWVATVDGLYLYNPKTKRSTSYINEPDNPNSLPNNWISSMYNYGQDQLLLATIGGLGIFNKKSQTFTNYKYTDGTNTGLSSNELFSAYVDNSGLIWIGTNGFGVNIYNPQQEAFKLLTVDSNNSEHALSNASVWEVNKAFGYLWIGTTSGLNRLDPTTGKVKHYFPDPKNTNSLVNASVVDIEVGNNRDLWLGTWNGISHFYIDDERFINYTKQVDRPETYPLYVTLAMHYDKKQDLLWLGSLGHGIAIFNPKTDEYTHLKNDPYNNNSLPSNYISYIHNDINDNKWIATNEGITRYNNDTKTFKHLTNNGNPVGKDCYAIRDLDKDTIVAGSSNGLIMINRANNEIIRTYGAADGLDDSYVYSIEIDNNGLIWVGTNLTLSRINPLTNEIKNFNITDGLQGYEFNGDASFNDGEYLYFGGYNGFNYFKPETINSSEFIPPIAITEFSIHNKPISKYLINDPIQLSYKDSFFSIEFAALDYAHPEKNQYAYMLEGFDNDWIYNQTRNYASYTNLDGGNYTFRVKAANKYGIWNNEGFSLPISITPPFWKTLWFRISSIVLIFLTAFSLYALRVRAIQARNKLLKAEVKVRTAELEDALLELGETKDALIDAAHKAGMADTATGVIHNVGNILNTVGISAGVIREAAESTTYAKLVKANQLMKSKIDEIQNFIANDPRGVKLIKYYFDLENLFNTEFKKIKDNATLLIKNISSIGEVINAQQRYAQSDAQTEELSLSSIIEDTIMLQSASIGRHEIVIEKDFDQNMPNVPIQKVKLVQILLNLYKNAKESMDDNKSSKNILTIKTYHDDQYAYIQITDTGIGIDKESLVKIFNYGFTTKKNGHGFGLHSCANYMTEMGGKIWAESDGLGHGAAITLKLRLKSERYMNHASAA